uniref:Uncharacterized protein n=1 Tax=Rhizophora mucronata TaxID=61149 RepID=A0A2P2NDD2_RHIMU
MNLQCLKPQRKSYYKESEYGS